MPPGPSMQHIKGFEALGANVDETEEYIALKPGEEGLHGARISLDMASVGATVNIMVAATLLPGQTVIENAAKEPHIVDLANFLNTMGARINRRGHGYGEDPGGKRSPGRHLCHHSGPDRGGHLYGCRHRRRRQRAGAECDPKHMECITSKLQEMGAKIFVYDDSIRVMRSGPLRKSTVKTQPYPGFPTDMQAQVCVCMALAKGISRLTESVYETRFFGYCTELESHGGEYQKSVPKPLWSRGWIP